MIPSPDYLLWWFEAIKAQLDVSVGASWAAWVARSAWIRYCSRISERAVRLIWMEGKFKVFSKKNAEYADTRDLLITAGRLSANVQ